MSLAYTDMAPASPSGPPLLILHGLFGAGKNWTAIARKLSAQHHVYLLDLPNHGASPWQAQVDYPTMAAAVRGFMEEHGLHGATVIGHSMGGKTAMTLALDSHHAIGRLVVVDIAPVPYEDAHAGGHLTYAKAMRKLDVSQINRRKEAEDKLADVIPDAMMRAFLMQNLERPENAGDGEATGMRWRVNLEAIINGMQHLIGFPEPSGHATFKGPTLFLHGGASGYLKSHSHARIHRLFPKAEIDTLPGLGHWPHAENPALFLNHLKAFLDRT